MKKIFSSFLVLAYAGLLLVRTPAIAYADGSETASWP